MLTKNDCVLMLSKIQEKGIDTTTQTKNLLSSKNLPLETLAFINKYEPLDLVSFYDGLRKNYNKKKSVLYKNIVKEVTDTDEALTTLSSLNLQILLFSKKAKDRIMFFKHSRAYEINAVLSNYYSSYDLTECLKLLYLIKMDLKACEALKKRESSDNVVESA